MKCLSGQVTCSPESPWTHSHFGLWADILKIFPKMTLLKDLRYIPSKQDCKNFHFFVFLKFLIFRAIWDYASVVSHVKIFTCCFRLKLSAYNYSYDFLSLPSSVISGQKGFLHYMKNSKINLLKKIFGAQAKNGGTSRGRNFWRKWSLLVSKWSVNDSTATRREAIPEVLPV